MSAYVGTVFFLDGGSTTKEVEASPYESVISVRSRFDTGAGDWLLLRRFGEPSGLWVWEVWEESPDLGGYEPRTRAELETHVAMLRYEVGQ